ncbi:hypothetical protein Taro_035096 [Colocasia esculenta]|uniref:Uncharacterized protein n=1 Tax=Colocasia esculenta TaxID=4460 RepID=A0A843VZI7_COLES|nr:hypothetical protein [Colocasia esculenta]
MATGASLAEQTTDEVEGSKVIDNAKVGEEDSVSQPKQTEANGIEKVQMEEQASSETSAADPKEMMEIKDEVSATEESAPVVDEVEETDSQASGSEVVADKKKAPASEEVKKEDEDDVASPSIVLEDKRENAPAVDEFKKETDSPVSDSEILGDNKEVSATEEMKKEDEDDVVSESIVLEHKKEDAPTVDEVKKEDDSQAPGFEVLVVEASTTEEVKEDEDDIPSASGVSVDKKEDAPAVGSEILGDNKEVSATEEMKKEDEDNVVSASVVLEDKKEDAPTVDEVKKEDDSQASDFEVLVDNNKASTTKEVKKEDKDGTASASVVSVDKKEDAPAVDEASGSEVLEDNKDIAFIVEDAKKEAETGKISGISDAEVEASVESPDEKSINTTESSSSVQESEHVEHKPEVSEPVVAIAKGTEEPLDISANVDLPSAKSREQSVALTVTEPADATEELEKKNETPEADEELEVAKHKNTTTVENIATAEGKAVTEPFEEKSVVELETSASRTLDTVPSDSAVSENIEKAGDDTNAGQCQEEDMVEESEHYTSESLGTEVTVDTTSANPPIATGETGAVDATSVTDAAEIVVDSERNTEEQKGEKTVEMESINEQKEEKSVEEGIKEQDQEKAVEKEAILTAAEEIEASSEREKPSKESKHENVNIEDNTTPAQTSRDIDLSVPATEVIEAAPEEEKPSEAAEMIGEKRDSGVSDSANKLTENLEKDKVSEVAEQSVEEPKQENESIKDGDAILPETSRDINIEQQANDIDMSTGEQLVKSDVEKSSNDAAEQDETEKKDEAGKCNAQDQVEAPKDGDSKPNPEVHKTEASSRTSKTLMSKVKHSIVKVKKAIIGKSPSSKTISAESKDGLKVK